MPINLLMKAELWNADGNNHVLKLARVANESQLLKGETAVSGEHLRMEEAGDRTGFFFCLGGLTIRCVGDYRLCHCVLYLDLNSY
jgi:hypothetical protein